MLGNFVRNLFSHFSRVKSHSRKVKPRNFSCPCVKWSVSILPTRNYCIHGFTTLAIDLGLHGSWQKITWRLSEYNRNVANKNFFAFTVVGKKNFICKVSIIPWQSSSGNEMLQNFLFATFQLYSEDYQSIIETLQINFFLLSR